VIGLVPTTIIDEWKLDDGNCVVVALVNYKSRWRVDARIWLPDVEGGTLVPGKGLALPVKHLDRLAIAIEKARRGAVARYLIKPAESGQTGEA